MHPLRFRRVPAMALSALIYLVQMPAEALPTPGKMHIGRVIYIQNHDVRLGIDLDLGGAITYLAPATNTALNLINSFDWGRQVQFSFYSGPVPYQPTGTQMADSWRFLGWNPIQSGDCFGHQSQVLKYHAHGHSLYVQCIPMQWPLNNVPAESTVETWLDLDGPVVKARCRLTNHRADHTQYPARTQELPAVYVNAPYHHLLTYRGDRPFSGDALSQINIRLDKDGRWDSWLATENWAAQVNDQNWGLGVWAPDSVQFSGGFAGEPPVGGPTDSPTGYIAPNRDEILDYNIVYEYRYQLIVGTVPQIRDYVYLHQRPGKLPEFNFADSRQGWHYADALDRGWPVHGELDIRLTGPHPSLFSPEFFITARRINQLQFEAAFPTGVTNMTVYWRRSSDSGFAPNKSCSCPVEPDNKFHTYHLACTAAANFDGNIVQLRLEPSSGGETNAIVRIKRISLQ